MLDVLKKMDPSSRESQSLLNLTLSQPEHSSTGISISIGKLSKLLRSKGPETGCISGGDIVRFAKPSQSKFWNHLQAFRNKFRVKIGPKKNVEIIYLCFLMFWVPPRWYPSRSAGISLQRRLISCMAERDMCFGKFTISMPFRIML